MTKLPFAVVAAATLAIAVGLAGCERDGPMENAGEKVDKALNSTSESFEDAGEAVDEAVDDLQEGAEEAADEIRRE